MPSQVAGFCKPGKALRMSGGLLSYGERDRIAEAIARSDPQAPEDELATLAALTARPTPRADPAEILPGVALEAHLRGRTLTLKLKGKGVTPALAAEIRALLGRLKPAAG